MKKSKFLKLAVVSSVILATTALQNASANPYAQHACLIEVPRQVKSSNESDIMFINADHVTMVNIWLKDKTVRLVMSNEMFANLKYNSEEEAKKEARDLISKINYCREDADKNKNKTPLGLK